MIGRELNPDDLRASMIKLGWEPADHIVITDTMERSGYRWDDGLLQHKYYLDARYNKPIVESTTNRFFVRDIVSPRVVCARLLGEEVLKPDVVYEYTEDDPNNRRRATQPVPSFHCWSCDIPQDGVPDDILPDWVAAVLTGIPDTVWGGHWHITPVQGGESIEEVYRHNLSLIKGGDTI